MRIIHVTSYYPPHLGGMEIVVKESAERLAKKGYQVEVFTSNIGNQNRKIKNTKNLKIHYLWSFEFAHTPIIPTLFFRLLLLPKNSIIHLHVAQAFTPEVVYLVSKFNNIPYIAHLHIDLGPSGNLGFLIPFYKKYLLGHVLRNANECMAASTDYINILNKRYGVSKNKIRLVFYGIPLSLFKKQNNGLNKIKNILSVGRFTKQKNFILLINSFNQVINLGFDLNLNLIGSGEEDQKIIKLINNLGLQKKVNLHGVMSWQKLSKTYYKYDLFIIPSREEAHGLVTIEAMASGLPIIASDIPGLRNAIQNNTTGILVKPTVQNFSNAIIKIVGDTELKKKLIKNGLEDVKKYDWEKIIQKYETSYYDIKN